MATTKSKKIRQKDKDIVSGYLKQVQLLFPPQNAYYNIVDLISNLILIYYSITFETEILNDKLQEEFISFLSANNKIIAEYSWELLYKSVKNGLDRKNFVEKVHQRQNVLLLAKFKDDNDECIVGGYTKSGWASTSINHTNAPFKCYSDKDAFVFCFRSAGDNKYGPFISNVKQTKSAIEHAIGEEWDCFGAFGHSWIFWFTPSGIDFKQHGSDGAYNNYEQFPNGPLTYLHSGCGTRYTETQLEAFQIEM